MSGTDPGTGPCLPADTEVDAPKPAERKEPPSGVSRAVREVPADVFDELERDLGGRPKVHMIETAETHGENGARFATVGTPAARERVKTEPNAKIMVAPTTVPPGAPLDGKALQREAAARMKAILADQEERERRRAPTEIDTREKKRRLSVTFWGLLIGAVVIALLVAGMVIHKVAEEGRAKPTPSGVASTVAPPTIPSVPVMVNPPPTVTLVSPPPSSSAMTPAPSASSAKPHGPKHGSEPAHTGELPTPPVPSATIVTPPASVAPIPTPKASASPTASVPFGSYIEEKK